MVSMPLYESSGEGNSGGSFLSSVIRKIVQKICNNHIAGFFVAVVVVSSFSGFLAGTAAISVGYEKISGLVKNTKQDGSSQGQYVAQTTQEQKIIDVVKKNSPAVVSIVITKDVPVMEQYFYNPFGDNSPFRFQIPQYRQNGTEKKEIGGGTGFLVSEDGMIITNKHVVIDEKADYTVFTVSGESYPAKVLAKDPVQDVGILKITQKQIIDSQGSFGHKAFPYVVFGNSDSLQIGQTVIAIGNALGEFRNTVSVGVVSGLGRTVTASGGSFSETIEGVIQTDAAINPGNSGGPLLDLAGEVIGMNTATVTSAQSIGFSIPVNFIMRDIEQVSRLGKIVYPMLGVRFMAVTDKVAQDNKLPVIYGAWVHKGQNGDLAVTAGSAAEKAGIKEGDIILELNGKKIDKNHSLSSLIQKYDPGKEVIVKIMRDTKEIILSVTLGERTQ